MTDKELRDKELDYFRIDKNSPEAIDAYELHRRSYPEEEQLEKEVFLNSLEDPDNYVFVAKNRQDFVGFTSCVVLKKDEMKLVLWGFNNIDSNWRDKGIAGRLINTVFRSIIKNFSRRFIDIGEALKITFETEESFLRTCGITLSQNILTKAIEGLNYADPPLEKGEKPISMIIFTSLPKKSFSKAEIIIFLKSLKKYYEKIGYYTKYISDEIGRIEQLNIKEFKTIKRIAVLSVQFEEIIVELAKILKPEELNDLKQKLESIQIAIIKKYRKEAISYLRSMRFEYDSNGEQTMTSLDINKISSIETLKTLILKINNLVKMLYEEKINVSLILDTIEGMHCDLCEEN